MYKIYLKQAWQMLKEDKVISLVTILGTALAITMTMVVILTQEIRTKNIVPEVNRDRTLYIQYMKEIKGERSYSINPISVPIYKQFMSNLKEPEAISMITRNQSDINLQGSDVYIRTDVKYTDPSFWNIYQFKFLDGKSFSKEEFQSGIPVAVLCKSLAQKLFKGESAVGKEFILKKKSYKVIGLVEDVSTICDYAYGQIWAPYTSESRYKDNTEFKVILLAKNKNDFKKVKSEVRQSEISNNIEKNKVKIQFWGPFSTQELLMKKGDNGSDETYKDPNLTKDKIKFFLTLAILLLIPAINLSGFSLFKIISRTSEIGIRKAFGANRKTILMQVLYENMLTSMIGGIIGLIISFVVVTLVKDRLFTAESWNPAIGENTIPISAFLSFDVFFYVFIACIVLNLLSAGIPAWRASRLDIVNAIKA